MDRPEFYTVQRFAELMSMNPKTLRQQIGRKMIRAVKLGKAYYIPASEIDRLKKAARYRPGTEPDPEPDTE